MYCNGYKIWIAAFSARSFSHGLSSISCLLCFYTGIYLSEGRCEFMFFTRHKKMWYFEMQMCVWSSGIWETCVMIRCCYLGDCGSLNQGNFTVSLLGFYNGLLVITLDNRSWVFFRELIISFALPFERKHLLNETESAYWIRQNLDRSKNPDSSAYS